MDSAHRIQNYKSDTHGRVSVLEKIKRFSKKELKEKLENKKNSLFNSNLQTSF